MNKSIKHLITSGVFFLLMILSMFISMHTQNSINIIVELTVGVIGLFFGISHLIIFTFKMFDEIQKKTV